MIINGQYLLLSEPIKNMEREKKTAHGMSYGLSEAGYDIRIKQEIQFSPQGLGAVSRFGDTIGGYYTKTTEPGRFILASAIEEFQMPDNLVGYVKDKSSWARQGLSVFNTVIEPGWKGFLTLELVFHGSVPVIIPAGAPIAQVLFHQTQAVARYNGKYQDQADAPIPTRHET